MEAEQLAEGGETGLAVNEMGRWDNRPRACPTPTYTELTPTLCFFHRKFGANARHCIEPCHMAPKGLGKPSNIAAVLDSKVPETLTGKDDTMGQWFLVD